MQHKSQPEAAVASICGLVKEELVERRRRADAAVEYAGKDKEKTEEREEKQEDMTAATAAAVAAAVAAKSPTDTLPPSVPPSPMSHRLRI
jgi:hypothetical protein